MDGYLHNCFFVMTYSLVLCARKARTSIIAINRGADNARYCAYYNKVEHDLIQPERFSIKDKD